MVPQLSVIFRRPVANRLDVADRETKPPEPPSAPSAVMVASAVRAADPPKMTRGVSVMRSLALDRADAACVIRSAADPSTVVDVMAEATVWTSVATDAMLLCPLMEASPIRTRVASAASDV
jgi:hypothetical protein